MQAHAIIYQAAKEGNVEAIEKMRYQISIDVRDKTGMHTPAGTLAAEGRREEAELLIRLGADVNYVIWSAAYYNRLTEVEYFYQQYHPHITYAAWGAAQGGHLQYAEDLRRNRNANVNDIAWGAVSGGHLGYALHLCIYCDASVHHVAMAAAKKGYFPYVEYLHRRYYADINRISKGAAIGNVFSDEKVALYLLSSIRTNHFRLTLAERIKKSQFVCFDIMRLAHRANKIKQIMNKHKLNYNQAIAYSIPELQIWFLQCHGLVAIDLLLHIASYLAPLKLEDYATVYSRMIFEREKNNILKQCKHQYGSNSFLFFLRDSRFPTLINACKETQSKGELVKVLKEPSMQSNRFFFRDKKNDRYSQLIHDLREEVTERYDVISFEQELLHK